MNKLEKAQKENPELFQAEMKKISTVLKDAMSNPDLRAHLALRRHLENAAVDPEIIASKGISDLLKIISLSYSEMGLENVTNSKEIAKVFGKSYAGIVASERAKAMHAEDPKQTAKIKIKEEWAKWRQIKTGRWKAGFARKMLDEFPIMESQSVIEGWVRKWEKEIKL